jgi:hypothetical protein
LATGQLGIGQLATGQFAVALSEQFDVLGKRIDKLRHHKVWKNHAGDDGARAGQIPDKVQYEFRSAGNDDHTCADLPPSDMLGDSGSNCRHVFHRVAWIVAWGRHALTL